MKNQIIIQESIGLSRKEIKIMKFKFIMGISIFIEGLIFLIIYIG